MPRAFLITHRRYNGVQELEDIRNEYNLEHRLHLAEYGNGQSTSDGASDCGSESSSECPEELYNLTKLAEVSLAAAAGTLNHPSNSFQQRSSPTFCEYRRHDDSPYKLCEKTRAFFERIESEREILAEQEQKGKHFNDLNTRIDLIRTDPLTSKISPFIPPKRIEGVKNEDCIEDHECPDCGKKYSTSSNLARHRQTHRSLGDKKARRCPHCDKVYVSIPAFSMHVRTHNQGCKCHFCGKCFSRPWLLQGHIRTHTGEKPFKCTICNKAFADKSNLRAHIQTHSNTKPHVCGRCGKAFALKSYLYKHEESSCMRAHQKPTPEKRDYNDKLGTTPTSYVRSSPTSVIVSRTSAFSTPICQDQLRCKTGCENDAVKTQDKECCPMVIRTSVISPNPEHLQHKNNADKSSELQLDVR